MRIILLLLLSAISAGSLGCAMCCAPFDDDYNAYGGVHPRSDMRNGRVGSVYAPADGAVGEGYSQEGEVVYEGGVPHEGMMHEGQIIHEGETIHQGGVIHDGQMQNGAYYEYSP